MKARTVTGGGDGQSLLSDLGSKIRIGREKEKGRVCKK